VSDEDLHVLGSPQRLARVLDEARRHGAVQIRRRAGELFVVQPARGPRSPLDVRGLKANLRPGELLDIIREISCWHWGHFI
jgi:hypothetical protein